jgi:CHAT domain-containing protein
LINLNSWNKLNKVSDTITFVEDLNVQRNNKFYIQLLIFYGINHKAEKIYAWLSKIRKRDFIFMEEYLWQHCLTRLLYSRRNQQLNRRLLLRIRKQFQEKKISHIHIVVPKSTKSNPYLNKFLDKNSREFQRNRLLSISSPTTQASVELFLRKDRKFSTYLSRGLHQILGTNSSNYYKVVQSAKLGWENIDGHIPRSYSFTIIKKAFNCLNRKFDRFKFQCDEENQSEKKIF